MIVLHFLRDGVNVRSDLRRKAIIRLFLRNFFRNFYRNSFKNSTTSFYGNTSEDSLTKSSYRNLLKLFQVFHRSSSDISYRISTRNSFLDFLQEFPRGYLSGIPLGSCSGKPSKICTWVLSSYSSRDILQKTLFRISTRHSSLDFIQDFFQESLRGFAPEISPEILSTNFFMVCLQEFFRRCRPGISLEISTRNTSVGVPQEF